MAALLDMSLFPLPAAVEELDYQVLRSAWLADYAARMGLPVSARDDNDPAVKVLETGASRELLVRQRINDAVRRTFLAVQGNCLLACGAGTLVMYSPTDGRPSYLVCQSWGRSAKP